MKELSASPARLHQFWLPHIGLFTGARVNEICQINPQTDILSEGNTPYFWLTADTESDVGIRKSIKTGKPRKVPIHRQLIELGLLDYIRWLKRRGDKRLFPGWPLVKGRNASSFNAIRWFARFLSRTGLKTGGPDSLRGMHAFRHTLLTYGKKQGLDLTSITGHADLRNSRIVRGYIHDDMAFPLRDRKKLLDRLDFNIRFFAPVKPE